MKRTLTKRAINAIIAAGSAVVVAGSAAAITIHDIRESGGFVVAESAPSASYEIPASSTEQQASSSSRRTTNPLRPQNNAQQGESAPESQQQPQQPPLQQPEQQEQPQAADYSARIAEINARLLVLSAEIDSLHAQAAGAASTRDAIVAVNQAILDEEKPRTYDLLSERADAMLAVKNASQGYQMAAAQERLHNAEVAYALNLQAISTAESAINQAHADYAAAIEPINASLATLNAEYTALHNELLGLI